jgi:CO/xanthine dehydrogenase Mo-binding subunit
VYRTPVQVHTALEPHGAVAEWDGDRLTIWESTQAVFRVREQVALGLGISQSSVRIIKEHMGGGFGAKTSAGAHTFAAAILARRAGRAVRCVNDREAEQTDTGNRPCTTQRVTLGARRDGRLTAIVCEADVPLGIGGWDGGPAGLFHEMYSCPNVRTVESFAWVNTPAMIAFRAPGHVEGAFALESAMDALARELDLDPLELRRVNFAERDEKKDRPFSSNQLRECYDRGAARFDWDAKLPSSGRWRRGKGMAAQVWPTGGGPPAYAIVKINGDGSADVLTGTQDLGTGSRTILAQIAAESLGARLEDVRIVLGDTERTPYAATSWGSMTTPSVGPAVRVAAEDALRQLIEAASEVLDVEPSRLRASDSVIATEDRAASITFRSLCDQLGDVMILGRGARGPNPTGVGLASFGAQFAEVEVDAETGEVKILRYVAMQDSGVLINPMMVEGQIHGGVAHGIGNTFYEWMGYDDGAQPVTTTFADYLLPTATEVPMLQTLYKETRSPLNPLGVKGVGEAGTIPAAAALISAVENALTPFGVHIGHVPLNPMTIVELIRAAGQR